MISQTVLRSFLLLHLTGFALFTGITIADIVALSRFWKLLAQDHAQAAAAQNTIARFPTLQRIGIALLVLSGIGMMAVTHGIYGEQLWFRIKFAFVLLLILNMLVGRRLVIRLRKTMQDPETAGNAMIIKQRLRLFHMAQAIMIFLVLLLSVFRFN